MADQVLQAESEAMTRLLPQVQELAAQVTRGLPASIASAGSSDSGAVPSLAAAQRMATGTVPVVRATVGARFGKVGELIEHARRSFERSDLTTSAQLTAAVTTLPTLQPPQ
jgi:hypothetical protein